MDGQRSRPAVVAVAKATGKESVDAVVHTRCPVVPTRCRCQDGGRDRLGGVPRPLPHERAGITEDLLQRCPGPDGHTPYDWLGEGCAAEGTVIDVGCGSGPMVTVADVDLMIRSLYLPGTGDRRVRLAAGVARRWGHTTIGTPLRRVLARREVPERW